MQTIVFRLFDDNIDCLTFLDVLKLKITIVYNNYVKRTTSNIGYVT